MVVSRVTRSMGSHWDDRLVWEQPVWEMFNQPVTNIANCFAGEMLDYYSRVERILQDGI